MVDNIFVVGLDDFHLDLLETVTDADDLAFHTLFATDEVANGVDGPLEDFLDRARTELDEFEGTVDAIIGHWDFPTSTILPILRDHVGLPGPSLESVLRCEHKYWSRIEQQAAVPEHVPAFSAFDPFSDRARDQIDLDYPFWVKPIKSHSSFLGFHVQDDADLDHAISVIRDKIDVVARPFNVVLEHADLPEEIAAVDGYHCIAEEIISAGGQCTLEGYVLDGTTTIYGAIDSGRAGKHRSSLVEYGYPSRLPTELQARMHDIASTTMDSLGFDLSPFNIEFFHDPDTDEIHLLEINPRISQSHSPLFLLVDGASHHQVAIRTAMGKEPKFPDGQGEFAYAAKFMLRHMGPNARVAHAPTTTELHHLQDDHPELRLELHVETGMELADLPMQDSYSFRMADLFLGGDDPETVRRRYEQCRAEIPIELEDL